MSDDPVERALRILATDLKNVDAKVDEVLAALRPVAAQTQQMANHVNFVERVYSGVRSRLGFALGYRALPELPAGAEGE